MSTPHRPPSNEQELANFFLEQIASGVCQRTPIEIFRSTVRAWQDEKLETKVQPSFILQKFGYCLGLDIDLVLTEINQERNARERMARALLGGCTVGSNHKNHNAFVFITKANELCSTDGSHLTPHGKKTSPS